MDKMMKKLIFLSKKVADTANDVNLRKQELALTMRSNKTHHERVAQIKVVEAEANFYYATAALAYYQIEVSEKALKGVD